MRRFPARLLIVIFGFVLIFNLVPTLFRVKRREIRRPERKFENHFIPFEDQLPCNESKEEKSEEFQTVDEFLQHGTEVLLKRSHLIEVQLEPNLANKRELVYLCLHSYQCGTWTEMLLAIIEGLLLADVTNRNFQICVFEPCKFEKFYTASLYNWTCTHSDMYWNEPEFFSNNVHFHNSETLVDDVLASDTVGSVFFTVDKSIMAAISKLEKLPPKWTHVSEIELYQTLHALICSKSKYLKNVIRDLLEKNKGELKSLSLEMGSRKNVNQFVFDRLSTLIQWTVDSVPDLEVHGVWELEHDVTLLVSTNSEKVFERAKREAKAAEKNSNASGLYKVNFIDAGGKIGNMNEECDDSCERMTRSVIEFELMLLSDALLVSHSKSSYLAAILRGNNVGLLCVNYSKMIRSSQVQQRLAMESCKSNALHEHFEAQIAELHNNSIKIGHVF